MDLRDRGKTCVYYQRGNCIRGDACEFNHPTVRCHTFQAMGFCPYGHACHFWHDPNLPIAHTVKAFPQKICSFFLNNQCKYGERCSYSHNLESYSAQQTMSMTLEEYRAAQQASNRRRSNSRSSNGSRTKSNTRVRSPRNNTAGAANSLNATPKSKYSLSDLSREEIANLNNMEVDQLLKKFTHTKIRKLPETETERSYTVIFTPTDPDWPYNIKEVILVIKLHRLYPKEPLMVSVMENDVIVKDFLKYINKTIADWLQDYHSNLVQQGRVELYLRQFFIWFDRSLERLFETGLEKVSSSH
ncbi:hypothetical protein Ciccas_000300 [Cichlidogyrus casuarinus]|uniref:RING-type E3 ubiquitin transferase n=1 Tax=Cichlidogyrus casuarinus TaxID=1844966 RepID=A0ABD2QPF5_9PLAT